MASWKILCKYAEVLMGEWSNWMARPWNELQWVLLKMGYTHLVGGFNPSEKICSSVGMMKFPIYGNTKHIPNHQPVNDHFDREKAVLKQCMENWVPFLLGHLGWFIFRFNLLKDPPQKDSHIWFVGIPRFWIIGIPNIQRVVIPELIIQQSIRYQLHR